MTDSSASRPKLATEIAFQIVDDIVARGLQQGDRLPSEPEMCELYDAGRATVREALRVLETQGVVSIIRGPGGGPRISDVTAAPMAANLALYLQRARGTLRDVMAVRSVIEPEIAALAAMSRRDVARPVGAESSGVGAERARNELVAAAADFHDLVATSTGNPLFEGILLALHRITEPVARQLEYSPERRSELIDSHAAIAGAIAAGDPQAARQLMRADLEAFVRHAEMASPGLLDRPIAWRQAADER